MADFNSSLSAQQIENILTGVNGTTGVLQRNSNGSISAAQVYPILSGSSAPTTSTVGSVNQLYRHGTDLYVCTAASTTYTWELVSGGGGSSASVTTCTLTVAGWSNNAQTVSVTGVTASNIVAICPNPTSRSAFNTADVYLTGQGSGTLQFACTTTPTVAIYVNVMILE